MAEPIDVVVGGRGPARLAARDGAWPHGPGWGRVGEEGAMSGQGLRRVLLLEREDSAGGVPRHCGDPPFGMREFGRVCTGPAYARRLLDLAQQAGVELHLRTT